VTMRDVSSALGVAEIGRGTSRGWGYDLLRLESDHHARNVASYRPNIVVEPHTRMSGSEHNLIAKFWRLLLPSGSSSLNFDVALACYIIRGMGKDAHTDENGTFDLEGYETWRQDILATIADNTGVASTSLEVTLADSEFEDLFEVFELASSESTRAPNVLSRMIILLRLAAFQVHRNISDGTETYDVQRWFLFLLEKSGLIDLSEGIDPYDLHEDYLVALEDFSSRSAGDLPTLNWEPDNSYHTSLLCRVDAVLAWALPF